MSLRVRFTVIVALIAALGFALPLATAAQLRLPSFSLFGKKQDDTARREQDEGNDVEQRKPNSFWNSLNPWAKDKTTDQETPTESNSQARRGNPRPQHTAAPIESGQRPRPGIERRPQRYAPESPMRRHMAESPAIPRPTQPVANPQSADPIAPNYSFGSSSTAERLNQIRYGAPDTTGLPNDRPESDSPPPPPEPSITAGSSAAGRGVEPPPPGSSRRPPSTNAIEPQPARDSGFRSRQSHPSEAAASPQNALPDNGMATVAATGIPSVRVETRGPKRIVMGEPAKYTVIVFADGKAEANGISVRIDIPESVRVVSQAASVGNVMRQQVDEKGQALAWTIDVVPAGGAAQLDLTLLPMKPQAFPLAVQMILPPLSADPVIEVLVPKVQMTVSIPEEMRAGRTYMCRVTMKNVGEATARDVALQVAMYDDVQESVAIEPLARGQEKTLEFEVVPQKVGSMDFQVTARTETLVLSEEHKQLWVRQPKLDVEAVGPRLRFVGTEAVYQITVRNSGDAVAENLIGAVTLPDGFRLIADADRSGGRTGRFGWDIGSIAPGAEKTYDIRCQVLSTGDKEATFSVEGADGLAAKATMATRVAAIADLRLSVRQPDGPVPVGEQVVYEFQIQNRGTREAQAVQCDISFPDEVEPLKVDGAQAEIQGSRIVVGPISHVGGHDTLVIRVSARARESGNHQFRAELTCPEPQIRLASEGTTLFFDEETLSATRSPATQELPPR